MKRPTPRPSKRQFEAMLKTLANIQQKQSEQAERAAILANSKPLGVFKANPKGT